MSKLYLRDTNTDLSSYANVEKSVAKPVGELSNAGQTWNMLIAKGAAQTLMFNGSSNANTNHQDAWMARFISEPINVFQVDANTWTIAVAVAEGNANANAFLTVTLYVLKADDTVRGFIYDTDTALGTEFGTTENGRVVTVSGAAVAGCVATDRIVLEVWWHTTAQAMATSYTRSLWVNGTTDVVNATATTDAASYLETPQDLFPAQTPPTVALDTADAASFNDSTPQLLFTGTDPEANPIEYEVQIDPANTFDTRMEYPIHESHDLSNWSTNMGLSINSQYKMSQSFISPATVTLREVGFGLRKSGAPTGDITVEIYAHSGTFGTSSVPTGAALATSDPIDASTLPTVDTLIKFTFSGANQISLVNGTTYVVVISYPGGDAGNRVLIQYDSTTSYPGNSAYYTTFWTAMAPDALCFYIYGGTPSGQPSIIKFSLSDVGFLDITNGADTHPFASADQIGYTTSTLADGTYYWRVRGKDPAGSNMNGAWSATRSFTVSTGGGPVSQNEEFLAFI